MNCEKILRVPFLQNCFYYLRNSCKYNLTITWTSPYHPFYVASDKGIAYNFHNWWPWYKYGRFALCFFYLGFLSQALTIHRRFLRHLFGALHVRWLPRIFNGNTCIYQTATRWYLPLIDWLIDWLIDCWYNVCLLNELILGLTWKTGVFELASTVTFELQANRLTKCALIKTDVQMQWKRAFQKLLI